MTRSFADDLHDDLENAFHDVSEFGELVTYQPKSGGTQRTINVSIVGTRSTPDHEVGLTEGTLLRVQCRRHAEQGIDDPQLGDALKRSGEHLAYAFTGQIDDVSPVAWTLTFVRTRPVQYGGNHQERTQ